MYKEGTNDFGFNHGFYYPQYICTGYESSADGVDHHNFFNMDGQDVQFTASSNEFLTSVYYAPDFGFAQYPYNPYNPYIPGACVGVDGSFVDPHQSYTFTSYGNLDTSPAYAAMILQSRPDITVTGMANLSVGDTGSGNKADGPVPKHLQKSAARVFKGSRSNARFGKQPLPSQSPLTYVQARAQSTESRLNGKVPSENRQSKVALTPENGLSDFELSNHAHTSMAYKAIQKFYGRVPDAKIGLDVLNEKNQGSDMYKNERQLVVQSYTSRAGTTDAQGNITIYMDQYNKAEFPLVYRNAKFFVIKSYSEDDVHKSIKYNVWSSTPNGNRKLNAAYEDAQKIAAGDSRGCPIFLMFSVNASGQFCGVAEMTSAVDPHKDMDFWQQDKWNGSFPVKWHIIKDVPNPKFRHIILENNENKPVTNSRDTQEISYKKGLEMLQIFQNYNLKTSLIDDFMYYERRQQILQEERAKRQIKSCVIPPMDPTQKHGFAPGQNIGDSKQHDANNLSTVNAINFSSEGQPDCFLPEGQVSLDPVGIINGNGPVSAETVPTDVDKLQISSMIINSEVPEPQCSLPSTDVPVTANSKLVEAVTIGSMLVRVTDAKSFGVLRARRP